MTDLMQFIACPRCDKTPLEASDNALHCKACKVDFPVLEDMPWMFAEPQASVVSRGAGLAEWGVFAGVNFQFPK